MPLRRMLEQYLGQAAKTVIIRERLFVVAVTGSVGKSTTKQTIAAVLRADSPEQHVRVTAKNYNNELGVPLTVFGLPAPGRSVVAWLQLLGVATMAKLGFWRSGLRVLVLEMGADKPGDIEYLSSIAKPDISVVTAVTPEDPNMPPVHLAQYPSIDALAEQKAWLVKAMKTGGTAILNADDKRVFAMRHLTHEHILTFGETDAADIRIVKSEVKTEDSSHGKRPVGIDIQIDCYQRSYEFFLPGVYGRSVAFAVAASVAVAQAMDISEEQVMGLSKAFVPMPGRTRIIPGIKHTTLFDDSYNSSPSAVLSSLRDLSALILDSGQRRVACLGEMRELGERSESMHRMVGAEAARLGLDLLVCCGIFGHAMAEGALANGMKPEAVKVIEDTPEAGLFIQDWIKPGDIILAKASEGTIHTKGVRMERVIKELMAEPMRAGELLVRQGEVWQRK